jgi:curved DNA-binding protein CbpA
VPASTIPAIIAARRKPGDGAAPWSSPLAALPWDIEDILKCAAGDAAAVAAAASAAGTRPLVAEGACRWFIRHVLFRPGASYYWNLGVARDAPLDLVRAHYRHLISIFHPDRLQQSDERDWYESFAKSVNEAYNTLKNPDARMKYDRLQGFGQANGNTPTAGAAGGAGSAGGPVPASPSRNGARPRFARAAWRNAPAGSGMPQWFESLSPTTLKILVSCAVLALVAGALLFARSQSHGRSDVLLPDDAAAAHGSERATQSSQDGMPLAYLLAHSATPAAATPAAPVPPAPPNASVQPAPLPPAPKVEPAVQALAQATEITPKPVPPAVPVAMVATAPSPAAVVAQPPTRVAAPPTIVAPPPVPVAPPPTPVALPAPPTPRAVQVIQTARSVPAETATPAAPAVDATQPAPKPAVAAVAMAANTTPATLAAPGPLTAVEIDQVVARFVRAYDDGNLGALVALMDPDASRDDSMAFTIANFNRVFRETRSRELELHEVKRSVSDDQARMQLNTHALTVARTGEEHTDVGELTLVLRKRGDAAVIAELRYK